MQPSASKNAIAGRPSTSARETLHHCTLEMARDAIQRQLAGQGRRGNGTGTRLSFRGDLSDECTGCSFIAFRHERSPTGPVVFTNKARCRDCYRCVRVCPVKAIRMHEGQANVVPQHCISCGTCVRECPQGAKSYRRDLDRARGLFAPGVRVAASVAPLLAAVFSRLAAAEVAFGLATVGLRLRGRNGRRRLSRCRGHGPSRRETTGADPRLHGLSRRRPLRGTLPAAADAPPGPGRFAHVGPCHSHPPDIGREARFASIFIGPCVAKKAEAERPENEGLVDCVLTFGELAEWFQQENIDLAACEESDFDEKPGGAARLFPLEGGSVRTSGWTADVLADTVVTASGYEEICTVLDSIAPGRAAGHRTALLQTGLHQRPRHAGRPQYVSLPPGRAELCAAREPSRPLISWRLPRHPSPSENAASRERHGGRSHSRRRGPWQRKASWPRALRSIRATTCRRFPRSRSVRYCR